MILYRGAETKTRARTIASFSRSRPKRRSLPTRGVVDWRTRSRNDDPLRGLQHRHRIDRVHRVAGCRRGCGWLYSLYGENPGAPQYACVS
jgi:hypothetical protein